MAAVDLFDDEDEFERNRRAAESAPRIPYDTTPEPSSWHDSKVEYLHQNGQDPVSTTQPVPVPRDTGSNNSGGGNNGQSRQYTAEEADFLRRNPGDEGRMAQALSNNTSNRPFDSQGPMYDQRTNSLNAAGQQELARLQNPSFGPRPMAPMGPVAGAGRNQFNFNAPGEQFGNDPYSAFLENIAKQQLDALAQPQSNPQLDRLLSFLDQRFTNLSQNPGYSPEEQAILRTQALEPIEQDRSASHRRSLERIAQRGMLPTSGVLELEDRDTDVQYDRTRAAAQRDLGVNAIGKRNQDLAQAQAIAQLMGIQIPQLQRAEDQQRRTETLNLGNLLYQMPRQAMFDANTIVNGSPAPPDLFNQAVQMLNAQQQNQQMNDQRNAAFWAQLGQMFGDLFQ